jgi:hypothetical protein
VDSKRFDELSKALATGRSRRTVLKGLAGGLVAGVAGLSTGWSVTARAQDGSGEQGDEGDPCSDVLTCGPGLVCAEGYCAADGSGEQGDDGDPCSEVLTCGPGLVCRDGTCQAVTLPTTGSGVTGTGPERLTGRLLGAATVVGAGAWVLRRTQVASEAGVEPAPVRSTKRDG